MREVKPDSRGNWLLVEDNEVGGHRYWSDEVGGGVVVWDTSLVSPEMLSLAIEEEYHYHRKPSPLFTATQERDNYRDDVVGTHMWLDDQGVPRKDGEDPALVFSLVGRIM